MSIAIFPLQDKKSLKLGPEDRLHLEGFALNVFAKADKQDRAGRSDLYVKSCSSYMTIILKDVECYCLLTNL